MTRRRVCLWHFKNQLHRTRLRRDSTRRITAVLMVMVLPGASWPSLARGAEARVSVDVSRPGPEISPYLYGQFIEHLGRCIYGGIWAEMLRDRKFLLETGKSWEVVKPDGAGVDVFKDPAGAYAGDHCLALWVRDSRGKKCGIRQGDLGIIAGKEYVGYAIVAHVGPPAPVEIRLAWGEGADDGRSVALDAAGASYRRLPFRLRAGATTNKASLSLTVDQRAYIWIACLSLMPADNTKGMRPDTLALYRKLAPPITRWPGGNFVSGYSWKDGIGDRDRRPPRWERAWKDVESNDFGIDEFLAFCAAVDTEPYIAVNTGLGSVEEAVEELEYANGAGDSRWGKVRARNGHPEPYGVVWWGIGNEMYGGWQLGNVPVERYALRHNTFVRAMKAKDASIRVVGVGHPGAWNDVILQHCATSMDLLAAHHYTQRGVRVPFSRDDSAKYTSNFLRYSGDVAAGVRRIVNDLRRRQGEGAPEAVRQMRLAVDEWGIVRDWNAAPDAAGIGSFEHYYTLGDAIAVARGLHELVRSADVVAMANWAQAVNVIGAIKTSRTHAVLDPAGHVLALYRARLGGVLVPVEVDGAPTVDAVCGLERDSGVVSLGLVNASTEERANVSLEFKGAFVPTAIEGWRIGGPGIGVTNSPGQPEVVTTRQLEDLSLRAAVRLPPHSVTVLQVRGKTEKAPARRGATLSMDRLRGASFSFGGKIGERVERNVDRWLLAAPTANPGMVHMFRVRDRKPTPRLVPWAGEFVGKYLISAEQALRMTRRAELGRRVDAVVRDLLSTQAADGYLGPFPRSERLLKHWDLWGHYHVISALLLAHERTGDRRTLDAALRAADLICRTYLDTGRRVRDAGSPEMNMAVIHVLGKLHRLSGKASYLRMVREIEKDWEGAGDYFRQGLAGVDFFRTPLPRWESLHDVQGLVELYRITGDERYRTAFVRLWRSIARCDRHNTGGFSSGEKAVGHPYSPAAIETCCTIAWMALTADMLRLTGDPVAADELELSTFNAATGAQHPSGRWWTYNTPMDGVREASAHSIVFQSRAGTPELNCCSVNAPRGLGTLSEWAVTRGGGGGKDPESIAVNYYGPCKVTTALTGGVDLTLEQDPERTTYPEGDTVLLRLLPTRPTKLTLKLRIPAWSRNTELRVNGEEVGGVRAGRYVCLRRRFRRGDEVLLRLDMRLRVWTGDFDAAGKISIFRGPLLLAYDQRFNDFDEDAIPVLDSAAIQDLSAPVLTEGREGPLAPWLLLDLRGVDGRAVRLCDFATAGATGTRYRSWLAALNTRAPRVLLDGPSNSRAVGAGRVLFRWRGYTQRPVSAAFRLVVSTKEDFSDVFVEEETPHPFLVPGVRFSPGTTYFWKVVSRNERGETESEARRFRVDAAKPSLSDEEVEALVPGADGLLVAAALRGDARPGRGMLQDVRGTRETVGPRSEERGALLVDGKTGRVRYRVPYFPPESYTVAVRVNVRSLPPQRLGQVFSAWAAGMDDPLRITVEGGKLFARIEAGRAYSTEGVPFEPGRWMHVAAVKDGARLRLHLDGHLKSTVEVPRSISSNAHNVALGANPNFSGNECLEAALADFRLYARALSREEVRELAREGARP